MNDVLKRLECQFSAYIEERDIEDEDGIIDISLACDLADSVPYLIEIVRKQKEMIQEILECTDDFYVEDGNPLRLHKELSKFAGQINVIRKVCTDALKD